MERTSLSDHKKQTIARIKAKGTAFEVLVDTSKALDLKKTKKGNIMEISASDGVFRDYKKGIRASNDELETSFGTTDIYEITKKMVLEGEILLPLEFKTKAREEKVKQVIDWLSKSCINPQSGLPHPPERIKAAMEEVGVRIEEDKPAEAQALYVIKLIQKILPIKIEVKRIAIKVPAVHTGQSYGVLKPFLIKEEWLADGSLSCVIEVPRQSLITFYDRLNSITHGTALANEI